VEVAVVIPAYNEERNISRVLSVLKQIEELSEVLIVNDGSEDKTSEVTLSYGFKVLELHKNMGKSYAMWMGLKSTVSPVVLFLDADLIGLNPQHVRNLISPVYHGIADMSLGIFSSGRGVTDLAQKIAPFLTGQRASKRWILESLPQEFWSSGFGIEVAITRFAKEKNLNLIDVPLVNVSHSMKEEKLGISRGALARLKMYKDITRQYLRI